jgi:soluble lytic murein transglycosylase
LKALVAAGNRYLATSERDKYGPLFKAAVETFPADNATAYCHWRIAWDAWLTDQPDRVALLREQVERYPDDSRAGTALYFLGRLAESADKYGEARAYYDRLSTQFPHYFYAVLGRERETGKVAAATVDDDTSTWLAKIDWPAHRDLSATAPNAATAQRIERARLLIAAGLPDVAEAEIRFGAKTETEQPQLLALELAASADTPFRALRIMKSLSGDYLSLPLENASLKFWQTLFPLPYKNEVFDNARAHGLDPFYVAGLIRQESEFNPAAKSRASAYGLMQLLPATGRMLGRKEGMRAVPASLLLNPAVSIRLGTEYLRGQLDSWEGDWFRTLAAYNAGPGRVHQWLNTNFREPIEFVESIPFTETREYVQAVLRNADMYRELYSGKHALEPEPRPKTMTPLQLAALMKGPIPYQPAPAKKTTVASHAPARTAALKKAVAPPKRPGPGVTEP